MSQIADPREEFIYAATWHGSLERAEQTLRAHPELASSDIHTAAILGEDTAVRRFLDRDLANATVKSGLTAGMRWSTSASRNTSAWTRRALLACSEPRKHCSTPERIQTRASGLKASTRSSRPR